MQRLSRRLASAILALVTFPAVAQELPKDRFLHEWRALIREPGLPMLDEPFGALDAFTREELCGVIRDLHQAKGFTVILVTHDLREAVYLADRVFVTGARPGRGVLEREVEFARPRPIDLTNTAEFNGVVHEQREMIAQGRVGTLRIGSA